MGEDRSEVVPTVEQRVVGYHWSVSRTRKVRRDEESKYSDDELSITLSGNTEKPTIAHAEMLQAEKTISIKVEAWESGEN